MSKFSKVSLFSGLNNLTDVTLDPEALLFHTGYLTLRDARELMPGQWAYTLSYPNHEVEASLNAALLVGYGGPVHLVGIEFGRKARNLVGFSWRTA